MKRRLWLTVALALPGCTESPQPRPELTGSDGTTTEATTEASTGSVDSTGAVPCVPSCEAGQECIAGTCLDMSDSSSTGEPPAECGLAVQLQLPNPACVPCAEASCCAELQGCFGDETMTEETECLQLNNCIAMACAGAMTDLMMCVDMNCADYSASLALWMAYRSCLGMSCLVECT
jgi:hypothetical protein